jgi:hypothetical protein
MFNEDVTSVKYRKVIDKAVIAESKDHVFTVLSDSKDNPSQFVSVVPSPLVEDFNFAWADEVTAWSWIMFVREYNVNAHCWPIEEPIAAAKCLWAELADKPVNDDNELEEAFLFFDIGTPVEDIWHWFEKEFDLSIGRDLN